VTPSIISARSLAVIPKGAFVEGKNRVSTIFFSFFTRLYNALYAKRVSAWVPLGGWNRYDGTSPRWAEHEIRNLMAANIDIVFEEMTAEAGDAVMRPELNKNDVGMKNFFARYRALIERGYVPPHVAEWVNHEAFAGGRYQNTYGQKLDLSTQAGEEYYYNALIAVFWKEYFGAMGPHADAHLAKKSGKVMVSLDGLTNDYLDIDGLSNTFLENIKARFKAQFGYDMYLMAHPLFGFPDTNLPAIDETHNAFGPSENFSQGGLERATGKQTIELLPGFWLPLQPEHFAPRSGGSTYEAAWQRALSLKGQVSDHLGITSWNYFPEGSQLDASQIKPAPAAAAQHPEESWGPTPRHYIDLTAKYAAQWNDFPDNDAQFLSMTVPSTMAPGHTYQASIAFRNTGNTKWTGATGYQLVRTSPPLGSDPREIPVDDTQDGIPTYGGILRGQPKTFTFTITAPSPPGTYDFQWRMIQQGVELFGDFTPNLEISVVDSSAPSGPVLNSVSPVTATNGQVITLTLTGENFQPGARIRVYYPAGTLLGETASTTQPPVNVVSPQEIQWGPFSPLVTSSGTYQLQVVNPNGQISTIKSLVVVDTTNPPLVAC
jgi:Ig-like domain from next to BRCA1 gene